MWNWEDSQDDKIKGLDLFKLSFFCKDALIIETLIWKYMINTVVST